MSELKKPRKVSATKGISKKAQERAGDGAVPRAVAATANEKPLGKAPKAKAQSSSKARSLQVSVEDIIRLRAYEIYLERGGTPGDPHRDWQLAEREVRAHFGQEADA